MWVQIMRTSVLGQTTAYCSGVWVQIKMFFLNSALLPRPASQSSRVPIIPLNHQNRDSTYVACALPRTLTCVADDLTVLSCPARFAGAWRCRVGVYRGRWLSSSISAAKLARCLRNIPTVFSPFLAEFGCILLYITVVLCCSTATLALC